jgi:hypothetical protein
VSASEPIDSVIDTPLTVLTEGAAPGDANELVMAWARDRATGTLRYILELGPEQRGSKSGCECISCSLPLTAVNAAKATYKRRPHFRHPIDAPKDSCLVLTARAAMSAAMQPGDMITLPRRRRTAHVEGLSGEIYEAWVERKAEAVRISTVEFKDSIRALLVLDDGRELEVDLVGSAEVQEMSPTGIAPRILITADDPAIASMSPEEIRRRLVPLFDQATWWGHWYDRDLDEEAKREASQLADDALDLAGGDTDLPPDLLRESLLHQEVKAILESTRRLRLPGWDAQVKRGDEVSYVRKIPETVQVEGAMLEQRLGRIIPDVIARLEGGEELLIEVTVTNHITEERLERIRSVNLPTLEIDISRMGGKITRSQLASIVTDEIAGKVWLHHPLMEAQKKELEERLIVEILRRNMQEAKHASILGTPVEEWVSRYLVAVQQYEDVYEDLRKETSAENLQSSQDKQDWLEDQLSTIKQELDECILGLSTHGLPVIRDEGLYREDSRIIPRLLSIKLDTGVGYRHDTGWQVINAIMQDRSDRAKSWHSLYLMAVRIYQPSLNPSQAQRVQEWRNDVRNHIESGDETYLRSPKYDNLLSMLFPEMANALAHPFGKRGRAVGPKTYSGGKTVEESRVNAVPKPMPPSVEPTEEYFEGAYEQRWMWTEPEPQRREKAKKAYAEIAGTPNRAGSTSLFILSLAIAYRDGGDPWQFALSLEHHQGIARSKTLKCVYELGLTRPMALF